MPALTSLRIDEHAPTIISIRTQALLLGAIPSDERGIFLAMAHGVRPGEARALDIRDAQERQGCRACSSTEG